MSNRLYNHFNRGDQFTSGCAFFIGFFVMSAIFGALCWPYAINTWLVFFDRNPVVVWWHGALLGLTPFLGKWSLAAAIATWILMLFIGRA